MEPEIHRGQHHLFGYAVLGCKRAGSVDLWARDPEGLALDDPPPRLVPRGTTATILAAERVPCPSQGAGQRKGERPGVLGGVALDERWP